ncbi:hypothetical protein [Pseudaestuariivita atlantica]|uniref:hypothetical protein n=1 Tax=Pseudaestuariivita atlantica TaxID=1317121 RepID=UPI0013F4525A|nr:hypothetical protein [Pseudaestuariivita atlantica]
MPFALTGLVLGAIWGGLTAYRRKGKLVDILQYAAGFGILFALIGLTLSVTIFRIAS